MTPSILTAAQEGLRLAEKHALLPHALKPLQDFQQHAHAHHADICRAYLEMAEANSVLRSALSKEVLLEDDYGVMGSTFYTCPYCHNESGAGVLNKGIRHAPECILHGDAACVNLAEVNHQLGEMCAENALEIDKLQAENAELKEQLLVAHTLNPQV